MDVSLMTCDGRAGSVAQVPGLKNPVRLARYILEQEAHVMLSGQEALHLGLRVGLEPAAAATSAKVTYWREHLDAAGSRPTRSPRWSASWPLSITCASCS